MSRTHPIFTAIVAAQPARVDRLLRDDPGLANVRDPEGRRPLHYAAAKGAVTITARLLRAGARVNVTGKHGETPLMDAADRGAVGVVDLLLARGAKGSRKNNLIVQDADPSRLAALLIG